MNANLARSLGWLVLVIMMCTGAALAVVAFAGGGWSALDFSSLTTLKTVRTEPEGVSLRTTYNPIAIVLPATLAVTGLVGIFFALLYGGSVGGVGSADVVRTGSSQLSAELSHVLSVIRSHLGSSQAYVTSLADAQKRLAVLDEAKQVKVIVSLLLAENERMRLKTEELAGKLDDFDQTDRTSAHQPKPSRGKGSDRRPHVRWQPSLL